MVKKIIKYVIIAVVVFILIFASVSIISKKTVTEDIKLTYGGMTVINSQNVRNSKSNSKGMGLYSVEDRAMAAGATAMSDSVPAMEEAVYEETYAEEGSVNYENGNSVSMDELLEVKGDYVHWTHNAMIETTEYTSVCDELANIIDNAKGYIEDSYVDTRTEEDSQGNEHTVRRGSFTIRIPEDNVKEIDAVLNGDKAELISHNSYGEDLTESYIKSETKIKAYEDEKAKLELLLQDAVSIEDILAINDRISSIYYELEYYNETIQRINKDVDFSTYYLTVDEVIYYQDTIEQYGSDVAESWAYVFEEWFSEVLPILFLILVSAIPFLIIIGITVFKTSKKIVDYKIKAGASVK